MREDRKSQEVVSSDVEIEEHDDPTAYVQLMYEQTAESDGVERIHNAKKAAARAPR